MMWILMVEHVCTAFPYQISGKTLDISGLFAIYSKLYAVKAISANRTSIVCGFIVETPPPRCFLKNIVIEGATECSR